MSNEVPKKVPKLSKGLTKTVTNKPVYEPGKGLKKSAKGKSTGGVVHRTLPMETRNALLDEHTKVNPTDAEVQQCADERAFMSQSQVGERQYNMTGYLIRQVKNMRPSVVHTYRVHGVTTSTNDKVVKALHAHLQKMTNSIHTALRMYLPELQDGETTYTAIVSEDSNVVTIDAKDLIDL
jgi:hypothetical protein